MTEARSMFSITLAAVVLAGFTTHLLAQGRPVTSADEAAGQAWWAHVKALADDGMEGRLTGSEGYLRAAKYVISQFDAARLQPAGVNGYYQPVKFEVGRVLQDKSSLALVTNGATESLSIGRDAVLTARANQPKTVEAPLVSISDKMSGSLIQSSSAVSES